MASIVPLYLPVLVHGFCLFQMYSMAWMLTSDRILSHYLLSIYTTLSMVCVPFIHTDWNWNLVYNYSGLLLAYYMMDIVLYLFSRRNNTILMILHHLVAIKLILLHVEDVLPVRYGITFVMLFEYSNVFLMFFQLCNEKGWVSMRNILSLPFVITYVPIRLIGIPLFSLVYIPHIKAHANNVAYHVAVLLFVDIFSIYFAVRVAIKFYRHLTRPHVNN